MEITFVIIMGALFAALCGYVASQKNRSVLGWAFAGALAGIFALIILAIVPTIKKSD
jgi:zinc transporter ZupT